MTKLYLIPLIFLLVSCSLLPEKKIYVSQNGNDNHSGSKSQPLQSLEAAQQVIRQWRTNKPGRAIRVILDAGTWYLSKPLEFTEADGGSDQVRVTWQGAPEGKTIVSGGKVIEPLHDGGYGIWWANVDSSVCFEQLYVNGVRAVRARTPNKDDSLPRIYMNASRWVLHPDSTVQNITIAVNDRGYFKDLMTQGDFEIVVFKDWTTSRFRAIGIHSDPAEIVLKPPFCLSENTYNSIFATDANHYSLFMEGDPSFLDQPGEWVLDRLSNKLFYKPLPGEVLNQTTAIAAIQDQLIRITGTREKPVKNLNFNNISFQHIAYILPVSSYDGSQASFCYPGKSTASNDFRTVSEAIRMSWASHCSFDACRVIHTAGNGFFLEEGCHNNSIVNTRMEDFGGNGVMIGLPVDPKADSTALPVGNMVHGCTLHAGGLYFQGAVGIWLGFCANTEVSECEVYDLPYTGISIGWQWNPLPTSSHHNRIINNKIHHVMQVLGDGGGIYTLGNQPGSVISGNDIHDILRSELNHASPNNGLFIDEGSKGYRIENNTIRNTSHTCIRGHRTAGVELINNTFYMGSFAAVSHTPPYAAMIFADKDTTIVWPNPGLPKELGYPDRVTAFTMKGNKFIKEK